MVTFAEITGSDDLIRVRRVGSRDVDWLWACKFWDNPASGMVRFEGSECWVEMVDGCGAHEKVWYRRFVVLRLTSEQHADEVYWQELFRAKVGWHMDYIDGVASLDRMHTGDTHHEFYDAYKTRTPPNYSGTEVLAWFEW